MRVGDLVMSVELVWAHPSTVGILKISFFILVVGEVLRLQGNWRSYISQALPYLHRSALAKVTS